MQQIGVLVSGYHKEDARAIKALLDKKLDSYVIMVGASPASERKLVEILREGGDDTYEEAETKILMFLGFSEVQTHMILEAFPTDGSIARPIFCTLTSQNQQMPFRELVAHLIEEHRHWKGNGR
jgi:hypothetical protein